MQVQDYKQRRSNADCSLSKIDMTLCSLVHSCFCQACMPYRVSQNACFRKFWMKSEVNWKTLLKGHMMCLDVLSLLNFISHTRCLYCIPGNESLCNVICEKAEFSFSLGTPPISLVIVLATFLSSCPLYWKWHVPKSRNSHLLTMYSKHFCNGCTLSSQKHFTHYLKLYEPSQVCFDIFVQELAQSSYRSEWKC